MFLVFKNDSLNMNHVTRIAQGEDIDAGSEVYIHTENQGMFWVDYPFTEFMQIITAGQRSVNGCVMFPHLKLYQDEPDRVKKG